MVAIASLACGVQMHLLRETDEEPRMMSTAILLKTGADHPAINLASADRGAPEGTSFAESLDENLGDGVLSQGKTSPEKTANGLWRPKDADAAKRPDQVAQALDVAGEKDAAGQRGRELTGVRDPVAEKIAEPRATIVRDSQSKALLEKPAAKEDVLVQEELGGLSPGRNNPPPVQSGELKDAAPVPLVATGKDDSSVIAGGRPAVLPIEKKAEPVGKTDEVASPKKTVRSPESGVTPKATLKNIAIVESGSVIQQRLDAANPPEGGVIPSGMTAATLGVTRDEGGATTNVLGEVSSISIPSTVPTSARSAGPVRNDIAHGVKRGVPDVDTPVTPVDASIASPNASPKSSMGPETLAPVPSVGSDGEGKIQNGEVSAPGLPHVMLGGAEALPGSNPSVALHGSAQGDLIAAKPQVGEAVPHSAGLPSGMNEQGEPVGEVPNMLTATPTSLEVGVQNGMHGWLKIRAEMTEGGVVNASVSTASSTGQEMLHRELPALTAYLVEEKVAVNAVVVHASTATGTDAGGSSGMGGAGGQASQRSNDGEERERNLGRAALSDSSESMTYRNLQGVDEDGSLPFAGYGSSGGWLSVRA
jgi:hypothetical protein